MSGNSTPSKDQILKAIEKLENNPNDKLGILADIGIGAVGAAGAGYAASVLGASAIFFGLIPVAAPLAVVAGGAILGGAALVGVKKVLFDGTFNEGKKAELLKQYKEQLRDFDAKERASKLGDSDKTKFIISLKEPVRLELIKAEDAQDLISAVENGRMSLRDATLLVENIVKSAKT